MKFKWLLRWRGFEIPVITFIVFLVALIWSLGTIIAPLTLPADSVSDLTGKVGTVENEDITEDMNPYAKFYYQAGDANCHTIKERSFFINGNQMPFCVRDVAIFSGLALGLGIALFWVPEIRWWWIIGGLVPIGVDGTVQLLTSYESTNPVRLLTGGLAGLVCALALGYVIYDASKVFEFRKAEALTSQETQEPYLGSDSGPEPMTEPVSNVESTEVLNSEMEPKIKPVRDDEPSTTTDEESIDKEPDSEEIS